MELSRSERLILANQFKILEALDDDEAAYYAKCRVIVENGFEGAYNRLAEHIAREPLTVTDCREVIDTLSMFEALEASYAALSAKERKAIPEYEVQFHGYSGNDETALMAYAEFCHEEGARFSYLDGRSLNSHMPARGRYREMLTNYDRLSLSPDRSFKMKPVEIAEVLRKPSSD
jgi:uncharacterized protein YfbU (UPF0304 family)